MSALSPPRSTSSNRASRGLIGRRRRRQDRRPSLSHLLSLGHARFEQFGSRTLLSGTSLLPVREVATRLAVAKVTGLWEIRDRSGFDPNDALPMETVRVGTSRPRANS